jgi:hypothetical protein
MDGLGREAVGIASSLPMGVTIGAEAGSYYITGRAGSE